MALGCGAMRSYIWISLRSLRSWAWSHLESLMGPALPFLAGVRALGDVRGALVPRGTGSVLYFFLFHQMVSSSSSSSKRLAHSRY